VHAAFRAAVCSRRPPQLRLPDAQHARWQTRTHRIEPAVKKGRLRQSVMGWCFNPMPAEQLARHAKAIGLVGIEGISTDHYPAVRELGLEISLVGSHGFQRGPFTRENHDFCIGRLREASTGLWPSGAKNVITFTGMREPGISDQQGAKNCVDCWKQVIGYAEEKGVNSVPGALE
jgi:hydroxypyruvate isomerase